MSTDPKISTDSTLNDVMADDIPTINEAIVHVKAQWQATQTPDEVCKLATTLTKLIEQRRKAFNYQWGASSDKSLDAHFDLPDGKFSEDSNEFQ